MNKAYKTLLDSFEWARGNTIDLYKSASENGVLNYLPNYKNDQRKNRDILYQFQCILTTTDARLRMIGNNKNKKFGILVTSEKIYAKRDISKNLIKDFLRDQINKLEELLQASKGYMPEVSLNLRSLIFHEHLHQGQLIVMFGEVGLPFPEEFDRAWNLSGQT